MNWSLPLAALKGRAGLDVNLALAYNSLVWTKEGSRIAFDADRGQPAPGFRLGLPIIQPRYHDAQTGANAYLLIMPTGARMELRQTREPNTYEATDGSRMQMNDRGAGGALLRASDGTQMNFVWIGGQMQCTAVKDANGNYITVGYNERGHLDRIVDTLGRTVKFNRDGGGNLLSITQASDVKERVLATFGYADLTIQTNFAGLDVVGPANGATLTVLTQVGLPDGTRYGLDYTSWGQVWSVTRYAADGHALARTSYDLPQDTHEALADCPRASESRSRAENWNDEAEAVVRYKLDRSGTTGEVTTPDGTISKTFFGTEGWQKGLPQRMEMWAAGVLQKWITVEWTQDNTTVGYKLNPRVQEVNIYDAEGNHRRTRVEHTDYGLPRDEFEYAADGTTVLRRTHTDYNLDPAYVNRRIIGLVSARLVYDGGNHLLSKTTHEYDLDGYLVDQGTATQHDDANYGSGFLTGRALECAVRQWDATDPANRSKSIASYTGYNTTGSPAFTRDARNRQTNVSYADSFTDGWERGTLAYATAVTDADGHRSLTQYDYLTGAVMQTQDWRGNVGTQEYDAAGRILQSVGQATGASTRWLYVESGALTATFSKAEAGAEEVESYTIMDGTGRVRATATDLPGSRGGYSGSYTVYDVAGRAIRRTNPTEMTPSWRAAGDDAAGWVWSAQEYDWKGRPTVTVNADGTTRAASYGGCGCAGGEAVTLTDESGRSRKQSKDALGRLVKVEELNWDGSTYATTAYTYNALNRMTSSNQSGQIRTWEYDGFGRTSAEVTPEQGRTEYGYNHEGAAQTVTDARGAQSVFGYNTRGDLESIAYSVPEGVAQTPAVTFGYNAEGRRAWMADAAGRVEYRYDERGRLTEETRHFTELPDSAYSLAYEYDTAGGIKTISASWGDTVGYKHDRKGRLADVTYGDTSLITGIEYRAWGAIKDLRYGNGRKLAMDYDERLRLTRRDVAGVQGTEYGYDDFGESTGRVTRARDLYDKTLDRAYEYDQVGRLQTAYTGQAARNHLAQTDAATPDMDFGPYNQQYQYDVWGNLTKKLGRANEELYRATYKNNRLEHDSLTGSEIKYDRAGNLLNDGWQQFTYDAAGHQRRAASQSLEIAQEYDGKGLRVRKVEGGATTYYVRSSILGNQVVADLGKDGRALRSYIYSGSQLLAMRDEKGLAWVHSDPVTKSKRLTDERGRVVSATEVDPWGSETERSFETAGGTPHGRKFTSYERDGNGSDDAQHRRYNAQASRFEQPDPYGGSLNPSDPQSLNRYAYTENDPVNHSDPSDNPQNGSRDGTEKGKLLQLPFFCLSCELYA